MMRISIIVARALNGVIGLDGGMPVGSARGLAPLQARYLGQGGDHGAPHLREHRAAVAQALNVVVSSTMDPAAHEALVIARTFDEALEACRSQGYEDVFAIGGEAIFREALPRAERLYLTNVFAHPEGDTYFPEYDETAWTVIDRDPRDGLEFVTLERKDRT